MSWSARLQCLSLVLVGCTSQTHTASLPASDAGERDDARTPPEGHDAAIEPDAGANSCVLLSIRTLLVIEAQGDRRESLGRTGDTGEAQPWELEGTVIAHGYGFPKEDDPPPGGLPPTDAKLSYLRVRGSDRSWTIVASDVPGFGVADGTAVKANFRYEWGGFSPEHVDLSLSVAGQLAFQYSAGGAVSDLALPDGWKVNEGDELCERKDPCGEWADYTLSLASASGQTMLLAPGETASLDGFLVAGASSQQLPGNPGKCTDWYVSASELLFVRQPPTATAFSCEPRTTSSLPGVEISFDPTVRCQFSLAEARAGISIPYRVVVADDVPGVRSQALDAGGCTVKPAGELSLFEELRGNGQSYGLADIGGCGGRRLGPVGTLRRGASAHSFSWDGVNWRGPSDTGQPKGPPFPGGVYTLSIRASGVWNADGGEDGDGGTGPEFELIGSLDILLTDS